jgi:hypothetical protein
MKVVELGKAECDRLVSARHYSKTPSIFWRGFGLVIGGWIEGCVVYGQPSPAIQKHAFKDRDWKFFELSRLVIQTSERNAASFLVGGSLRMLETPCAVVSYADTAHGHAGIVYQATNWIYTGSTVSHDVLYIVNGKPTHPMTLRDNGITAPMKWAKENGIETVRPKEKHRYFKLCGNRAQVRRMASALAYAGVKPYPKLPKSTYENGERIAIAYQETLF